MKLTPEQFVAQSYDYLIVGGGTAGLVLAARLSEDEDVTVGVLEAGEDRTDDLLLSMPAGFPQTYEKPEYDWYYKTTPQEGMGGQVHGWPRGKVLGGSSMINYQLLSMASKEDLDNFVRLGNTSLGWDDLLPYYRKFETYHPPGEDSEWPRELSEYIDPSLRGSNGPIQISFPGAPMSVTWMNSLWPKVCLELGHPSALILVTVCIRGLSTRSSNVSTRPHDPRRGSSLGAFNQPLMVDPKTKTRSSSASAYYRPNASRKSLLVLTGALVTKVQLKQSFEDFSAQGVEFSSGGKLYSATCNREVVLCGGVINSPQLLELSGIGSHQILDGKVECLIGNPNVGENLRDHIGTPNGWPNPELFAKVTDNLKELLKAYPGDTPTEREIIELEARQIFNKTEADVQIYGVPGGCDTSNLESPLSLFGNQDTGNYMSVYAWTTRTFSRGNVHIKSADPTEYPAIDPKYLSHPVDVELLALAMMHFQELTKLDSFASKLALGTDGKPILMPCAAELNTMDDARKYVRKTSFTTYHPIGTCSMLPKEKGGVVDSNLLVYGTTNLRVCDASIFPIHVQGNICSLVWASAEKGADIMKAARKA
ncbi:alcohol oxidase [Rhizodiscina lignyota]|uniref:Alcohol oxidase n=1 Tax=Rhizodiscina lignyota TaxID=1504668 RepID=A0A9P4M567_9PEZI|nr:alcohol oxidase [Rhizodiscina lignyota]